MRWFKKTKKSWEITNEDWDLLARMFFRYMNRDVAIPKITNMTQFIEYALAYNATIYSIISLRANAAKGIPWVVYKVKNKVKLRQYSSLTKKDLNLHKALSLKKEALEEVDGTWLNSLLKNPNPLNTLQSLIEEMFIYRDTTGNSYLSAVTNPVQTEIIQLFSLPADKVEIVAGDFINPVKGYRFDPFSKDIIEPEKVMHWKYFNPRWDANGSNLYGMSPLQAAIRIINNDNSGVDSQNAAFANEGVKGIITGTEHTDIEFTAEQGEMLKKKFARHVARAKEGKGNIAFNRAPLNYLKIGDTPVDLGVLDSRKYNKEVLCNLFRIHPSLLSSEASTLNNLTEARKALLTMSVLPDMDGLRDGLNSLIGRFYEGYFIDYDIMAISELQDDIEKLGNTLKQMDWVTLNEKRRATDYDDYDHPGADLLYTDMGKIPINRDVDTGFDKIDEELDKARKKWPAGRK